MKSYPSEAIGQTDFYARLKITPTLEHNTDGVWRGNLFEHKLKIDNTDKVLFQAIKYASRMRERGEKLPANLVLNDLNQEKAYLFKSADFLHHIEKVYFGAASKDNEAFTTDIKPVVIDYSDFDGEDELRAALKNDEFIHYHVDHSNILGLADQFYKQHPDKGSKALKDALLDGPLAEIRTPNILADRILPYADPDNTAFGDIMDSLNPGALQRELGAFYTPPAYVAEMHKLLVKAIAAVPSGMDYLVIDRCAGVGNLERGLPKEVLKHCVLSTLEPNEYQLLRHHFADDCAVVVPNTDALSYDIIPASQDETGQVVDDFIRDKVNDPNCVIILMENPPFSAASVGAVQTTGRKENLWKKSVVHEQMVQAGRADATSDLAHLFIWSGFEHYLKKPEDSYLLFAPTAYWRNRKLVAHRHGGGFLCNRKEFHASQNSAMACVWWKNQPSAARSLDLDILEIDRPAKDHPDFKNESAWKAKRVGFTRLNKADRLLSEGYDRRKFDTDTLDGVLCELNGAPFTVNGRTQSVQPVYNTNMIGYVIAHSFTVDRKMVGLLRCTRYDGHGFFLRSDNFLEKLPLFVAAAFPYSDKWWTTDVYSKSFDGNGKYANDHEFLRKCLFYTALTNKNKCRSFRGADKRFYRNELCLAPGTLAQAALDNFATQGLQLKASEIALLKCWSDVQFEAAKTPEHAEIMKIEPTSTLGLWQIQEEINVRVPSGKKNKDGSDVLVHKHAVLNTKIIGMDRALKDYYRDSLVRDLLKHELLK